MIKRILLISTVRNVQNSIKNMHPVIGCEGLKDSGLTFQVALTLTQPLYVIIFLWWF